jgi:biopolymer transport protein TolR
VQVSKDGLKLIDRNRGGATSVVTKATLVQAVQAAVGNNAEQAVVIAGDKDVRYEEVLIAMDALQRAGVQKVGLLAKPAAR